MANKYYIWNNPSCGGVNIIWKEVTGKDFYALMKLPDEEVLLHGKNQHFRS